MSTTEAAATRPEAVHVSDPRVQDAGLVLWWLNRHPDHYGLLLTVARQEQKLAATNGEITPYVRCVDCGAEMALYREDGAPACEVHR